MKRSITPDLVLGLGCVLLALLLLLIWIPLDTETGIVERVRGRQVIGDAMAPTVVGAIVLLAGLLLTVQALRGSSSDGLSRSNLAFIAALAGILAASLMLMRWTGPLSVEAMRTLGVDLPGYRQLRDTLPWKYLGYLFGGTFMVAALITFVERGWRWRSLFIAFIAALIIALIYDVPFKSLLLPPNGDV